MLKPGNLVLSTHPIMSTSIGEVNVNQWHRLNNWTGIVQTPLDSAGRIKILLTHNNNKPIEDLGLFPFIVNTPLDSIVDLTPYQGILEC